MEFSHWFAGFCIGGGIALMFASYEMRRMHYEVLDLANRMEALAYHMAEELDDTELDEEEIDEADYWKFNQPPRTPATTAVVDEG